MEESDEDYRKRCKGKGRKIGRKRVGDNKKVAMTLHHSNVPTGRSDKPAGRQKKSTRIRNTPKDVTKNTPKNGTTDNIAAKKAPVNSEPASSESEKSSSKKRSRGFDEEETLDDGRRGLIKRFTFILTESLLSSDVTSRRRYAGVDFMPGDGGKVVYVEYIDYHIVTILSTT